MRKKHGIVMTQTLYELHWVDGDALCDKIQALCDTCDCLSYDAPCNVWECKLGSDPFSRRCTYYLDTNRKVQTAIRADNMLREAFGNRWED